MPRKKPLQYDEVKAHVEESMRMLRQLVRQNGRGSGRLVVGTMTAARDLVEWAFDCPKDTAENLFEINGCDDRTCESERENGSSI